MSANGLSGNLVEARRDGIKTIVGETFPMPNPLLALPNIVVLQSIVRYKYCRVLRKAVNVKIQINMNGNVIYVRI